MARFRTILSVWQLLVAAPLLLAAEEAPAQAASHKQAPCLVVVEGEVRAGKPFQSAISPSLELLLDPVPHGWILRVLPTSGPRPSEDFAELATPPFRSINPLLLTTEFGFRAQDVIGWNPRPFHYLRRRSDFPAAEQAYRALAASAHPAPAEQLAVVHVAASAAEGHFEILDARLVPGTADQTPSAALVATHFLTTAHSILPPESQVAGQLGRVEWMRFRATLEGGNERPKNARCP